MNSFSLAVLLSFIACALCACVAPPSDLNICPLSSNARIPQEYANTDADRNLQSYFQFLQGIKSEPTKKCAEAYIEFACSQAYPKCNGDAASGLSYAVNTCYFQCSDFIEECRGQLPGVDRPNCGQFSVTEECTQRGIKISSSSTLNASLFLTALVAVVAFL